MMQHFLLTLNFVLEDATVTVHAAVSMLRIMQWLLFMLYLVNPDEATLSAHVVFYCSHCMLFQTTQQLLFTLYLLASNPRVQDKVHDEVQSVVPEYPAPLTTQNINSMPYLRACMKESTR